MPSGNDTGDDRTNFLPTIEVGAEVACKRDENPMKNAKKKQLRSKYFMRKCKQFSYLIFQKVPNGIIKLHSHSTLRVFREAISSPSF